MGDSGSMYIDSHKYLLNSLCIDLTVEPPLLSISTSVSPSPLCFVLDLSHGDKSGHFPDGTSLGTVHKIAQALRYRYWLCVRVFACVCIWSARMGNKERIRKID